MDVRFKKTSTNDILNAMLVSIVSSTIVNLHMAFQHPVHLHPI